MSHSMASGADECILSVQDSDQEPATSTAPLQESLLNYVFKEALIGATYAAVGGSYHLLRGNIERELKICLSGFIVGGLGGVVMKTRGYVWQKEHEKNKTSTQTTLSQSVLNGALLGGTYAVVSASYHLLYGDYVSVVQAGVSGVVVGGVGGAVMKGYDYVQNRHAQKLVTAQSAVLRCSSQLTYGATN